MSLRFIHVVECDGISFLFEAESKDFLLFLKLFIIYFLNELVDFYIFAVFKSIALIVLFGAQIVPSLASRNPFKMASEAF